jgi:hypothetical protein
MKPSMAADAAILWNIRIVSAICFLAPIAITLWVARLPDPVPDFLGKISKNFFERDGLCFLFTVEKSEPHARMVLYHQNRFDKPCNARIVIGPTPKAFADLEGLPRFEFSVSSQSAEFGKQSLAWSVPSRFQGTSVLWDVAAQVKYPSGRGVLLRGRNGANVGDHLISTGEEAVKAVTGLVLGAAHLNSSSGRSARVELIIPKGVASDPKQPSDLLNEMIWKLGDPVT